MSWAFIDDNFPNHPKAVQAGPVAAYLFVCGLCYCRRYHTDGFIPERAVKTLGVSTNPQRLIEALIVSQLWEQVAGGFQVHDYRTVYADDEATKAEKEARYLLKRDAGRKGGLARAAKQAAAKQNASTNQAECLKQNTDSAQALMGRVGPDPVVVRSSSEGVVGETDPPLDVWLGQLQADYPQHRVTFSHMTSQAFVEEFRKDPRPAFEVWTEMRANLENQKRGHEWRVKGMTPKLETWLRDGRWRQRHDEHPVLTLVNEKTARTLSSADAFVRGGS